MQFSHVRDTEQFCWKYNRSDRKYDKNGYGKNQIKQRTEQPSAVEAFDISRYIMIIIFLHVKLLKQSFDAKC